MTEPLNIVVAIILLSLSLYLAHRIYKIRFYTLRKNGWFASLAFLTFAVMVLANSLMLSSTDYAEAEFLARLAVTSAVVSGFFALNTFLNTGSNLASGNKIGLQKLTFSAYGVVVIGLTWLTTPFTMESTMDILGSSSYFPIPTLWYMLSLYFGAVLFSVSVLRSGSNLFLQEEKGHSRNEKLSGSLCASIAVTAFIFDAILPYASINLISLGHLFQIGIFAGVVYLWRGSTLIETFFVSLGKSKNKEEQLTQIANRTILKVEPGSDYTRWINDFLQNSDPDTNLLITHEGSRILRSHEFSEKCKIVCFSLSEDSPVRKQDDILVVRLSEEIMSEILKWTLQNMKNGKLVFDNLSHFTLLVGLESTYALVTMISELSNRHGVDVLFIVSDNSLDEKAQHALEELVDDVLTVKKGSLVCSTKS